MLQKLFKIYSSQHYDIDVICDEPCLFKTEDHYLDQSEQTALTPLNIKSCMLEKETLI